MNAAERVCRETLGVLNGNPVSSRSIMARYGVSLPTAKRDLQVLRRVLPLVRELHATGAPSQRGDARVAWYVLRRPH